jgi:hypothetical protein
MRRFLALAALAALLVVVGCSSVPNSTGYGTVRLQMTDAPGSYDAVNLEVIQVAIHREISDTTGGWEILRSDTASYDLMTLRNGVFTTLAQAMVPAGHYSQVRLKLGAGSNVMVDGVTHPLIVPSGMQSGYKLIGGFDVPENRLVDIALDFDAERSVHLTGSGKYMLKPTVRMMPFSTAGAIAGHLLPEGIEAHVYAIMGVDTLASTVPGMDGHFTITPLGAGTYAVAIHPAEGWRDTSLADVIVVAQQTTQLGDIELTAE